MIDSLSSQTFSILSLHLVLQLLERRYTGRLWVLSVCMCVLEGQISWRTSRWEHNHTLTREAKTERSYNIFMGQELCLCSLNCPLNVGQSWLLHSVPWTTLEYQQTHTHTHHRGKQNAENTFSFQSSLTLFLALQDVSSRDMFCVCFFNGCDGVNWFVWKQGHVRPLFTCVSKSFRIACVQPWHGCRSEWQLYDQNGS